MTEKIGTKFHDKTEWQRGEWDNEYDKLQWLDEETKLNCLIVRNSLGSLCGYVGVPESHVFYEKTYSDCLEGHEDCWQHSLDNHLNVHGGITFNNHCQKDDKEKGVCHVTTDEDDTVWWIGFDCAHAGDISPSFKGRETTAMFGNDVYRNMSYVIAEVISLAAQLKEKECLSIPSTIQPNM